jgi:hypothetical protein
MSEMPPEDTDLEEQDPGDTESEDSSEESDSGDVLIWPT